MKYNFGIETIKSLLYTTCILTSHLLYDPGSATLGSPVNPGTTLTYIYIVTDNGPRSGSSAGDCVTSLYYSDVNFLQDTNSGLVGMLIVCQPGIDN